MSSDVTISIQDISKSYRIPVADGERPTTLREAFVQRARHPLRRVPKEDFSALTDVSFDVERGEVVGVIGRNGAGKSTLLKILSRIVSPTAGRIELYGRLGSLLEVGTGFHPELTGRENVYLNGAILGMKRREIDRHFDSIVAFSEIDRFLDTPVKRYSSGMYVRLAFAVAAHLEPDILLVDEVLAVGDSQFQRKCLGKMDEIAKGDGRTLMFVSHNMPAVQSICSRTVLLEDGVVTFNGSTSEAVERYLLGASAGTAESSGVFDLTQASRERGITKQVLQRLELRRGDGRASDRIAMGDSISIVLDVDGLSLPNEVLAIRIMTDTGIPVAAVSSAHRGIDIRRPSARQDRVVVHVPNLPLVAGQYVLDVSVRTKGGSKVRGAGSAGGSTHDRVERAASFEVVPQDVFGSGFRFDGQKFGVVYMDSYWEVESDGAVTGATTSREAPSQAG